MLRKNTRKHILHLVNLGVKGRLDIFYDQVYQPADLIHLAQDKIQRRVFVKKTMTVPVLQLAS
jgi:hypothetical protein